MARLVSYKARDENRYSTFGGEVECNSSENLTETNRIKLMFKTKSSSASTPSTNGSQAKKKSSIKSSKKCKKSMPSSQRVTISTIATPAPSLSVGHDGCRSIGPVTQKKRWQSKSSKSKLNCCPFWSKQCTRKRNCAWRQLCCCCSRAICCFCCVRCKRNADDDDGDDDDDIDAKFEQYKREMKLNGATMATTSDAGTAFGHDNIAMQMPEITFSTDQVVTFHMNGGKTEAIETQPSPTKSKRFRYRKYWNWNDSLRSNSDKFLETLEYDMDGENSLKRNQHTRTTG